MQWHCQFFTLVSYLQSPIPPVGAALWGMATCSKRLGQAPSSVQCRRVFRHSRLADAHTNGRVHSCVELFRRHFSRSGPGLQDHRPGAYRESGYGLRYRGPRGPALVLSDPDKFVAAAPSAFLMVALIVLIFGAGRIAADTAIGILGVGSARVKQANSVPA